MSRDWYLQIVTTEFVRWGYGPGPTFETGMHTDRAKVTLALIGDEPITFEFELPETTDRDGDRPPVEYGRKRCVGWRFSNGRGHDTGWELCSTIEEAKAAALAWANSDNERHGRQRRGERPFLDAMNNIRIEEA